ncbi:MAG: hypothetical protein ACJ73S_18935 [Mycobacteriales bacterium]
MRQETSPRHAAAYTTGMIIFVVLSLGDAVSLAFRTDDNPPLTVAIISTVLGLLSLGLLALAWRGSRKALAGAVVLRLLSALLAIPALFVDDVPAGWRVVAGVGIVLTAIATWLVAPALRRHPPVGTYPTAGSPA